MITKGQKQTSVTNKLLDKQNVVYLHNGTEFNTEWEEILIYDIWMNLGDCCPNETKTQSGKTHCCPHTLPMHQILRDREQNSGCQRVEGKKNPYLIHLEFQVSEMREFGMLVYQESYTRIPSFHHTI